MEKSEKIGKITLDYEYYPGEDFYCDGVVEDELLSIAKNYAPVEFPKIIEERKNWPILYHLSLQRENIVSWLPITKDMKVLEIGSGCGAITGALAKKAGSVTSIDLSKKRSMINAYRHEECDNVTIKVGNFQDIEPSLSTDYDYALLIGVFEYGQSYIGGETPFEDFLKIIRKHVKPDGNIVIAIENKYGLKYWAGCREDHLGTFFSGLEGYPDGGGVRTFSKRGLENIFKACGENEYHFYYPYPDYKFMTTLYSDKHLPQKGELTNNYRNFDRDRMLLFDEKRVFDGMIEEKMFPFYSNSFLVVIGNKPDTEYARFSNDRATKYQIYTEILSKNKERIVKKHALSMESREHIAHIAAMYPKLEERYDTKELRINPVLEVEDDSITFSFEKGVPLTKLFDECLEKEDMEGFYALFREFVRRIGHNPEKLIADYDLVFSNILVEKNNWKVIDYEWTYEKQIPVKELAFRALYCYLLEDEKRNKFNFDLILEELGISQDEAEEYRNRELLFQKNVTGKRMSMPQLRDILGGAMVVPQNTLMRADVGKDKERIQLYFDYGEGFCEENSCFVEDVYDAQGFVEFTYTLAPEVKNVRIDPYMDTCMTTVTDVSLNGEPLTTLTGNGKEVKGTDGNTFSMVFATQDPNITVKVSDKVRSTGNAFHVSMKTVKLPEEMAGALEKELRKKIRL